MIKFSSQDNGACPLCKKFKKCIIIKNIKNSIKDYEEMEIVIYKCPSFKEE